MAEIQGAGSMTPQPRDYHGRFVGPNNETQREEEKATGQFIADIIAAKDAPKEDNAITRALRAAPQAQSTSRPSPREREPEQVNRRPWDLYGAHQAKVTIKKTNRTQTDERSPARVPVVDNAGNVIGYR
jgi:hypothetical protein